MSAISFPSTHTQASSSSHENGFYGASFDGSVSFQINPLSSHPPRTPRTSDYGSNSHNYSSTAFEMPLGQLSSKLDQTEELSEPETEEGEEKASLIPKEEIWKEMFVTSNGRDKAFKLIQYSLRLYLLFHNAIASRRSNRPAWELEFVKRLSSTVSGLSFSRKTLLLFNWVAPLTQISAQQSVPFSSERSKETKQAKKRPFLHTLFHAPLPILLELATALSDDVATCARMGLVGQKTGDRAARFAAWCWMLCTMVGLVENSLERQINHGLRSELETRVYAESMTGVTEKAKSRSSRYDEKEVVKLQEKDYWLQMTRVKLLLDLIFVSYDIFKIKRAQNLIMTLAGLGTAILSSAKLYDRHKKQLLKSVSLMA